MRSCAGCRTLAVSLSCLNQMQRSGDKNLCLPHGLRASQPPSLAHTCDTPQPSAVWYLGKILVLATTQKGKKESRAKEKNDNEETKTIRTRTRGIKN